MAQADGQVLIDTKIRTDGMEEGFRRIKDDVGDIASSAQKAGNQIKSAFSGLDVSKPVEEAMKSVQSLSREFDRIDLNYQNELNLAKVMEAELEKVKHILANAENEYTPPDVFMDAYSRADELTASLEKQKAVVASLEKQWSSVNSSLESSQRRLTSVLSKEAQKQADAQEKASIKAIKAAEKAAAAEAKARKKRMKEAFKGLDRAKMRMSEIALGSIIYNTLGQAILSMTKYVGAALKSNDQFSASFARLKGALLTAFQPIYEVVLPALISLMNVLSAVITVIGRFFAALAGKSYSQMQKNAEALHEQAGGIGAVGAAAKKAKRELAGFDEINKLSFPDASGGGGGGAGIGEIGADFADGETIANLNQILYLVGAVATALLGWKIAKLFTDDLSTIAGVAMAAAGAFLMVTNWVDALVNGIDWENLNGIFTGLALVVGGLALAFGSVGASIGLLVGGVSLVVLAFKDWITTGELSEEACSALVVGIMAIGTAISLLTGGPIPAIIAAIVAFCFACVTYGDEIIAAFNSILDFIKGIFLRDWREVFGETLGSIINGLTTGIADSIEGLKLVFGGLIGFISGAFSGNWEKAWKGVKDIAAGVFNTIIGAVNGLVQAICAGMNAVIRALNKISFTIPKWVPKWGGKKFGLNIKEIDLPQIPYLAKGAVIPPNAPFLAMLGDQKHGTNIEAPLSTIEEAVERVMSRHGNTSDERVIVLLSQILEAVLGIEIDGATLSKAIDNYRRKEAVMRG